MGSGQSQCRARTCLKTMVSSRVSERAVQPFPIGITHTCVDAKTPPAGRLTRRCRRECRMTRERGRGACVGGSARRLLECVVLAAGRRARSPGPLQGDTLQVALEDGREHRVVRSRGRAYTGRRSRLDGSRAVHAARRAIPRRRRPRGACVLKSTAFPKWSDFANHCGAQPIMSWVNLCRRANPRAWVDSLIGSTQTKMVRSCGGLDSSPESQLIRTGLIHPHVGQPRGGDFLTRLRRSRRQAWA